MGNNHALYFNRMDFAVIPFFIQIPCWNLKEKNLSEKIVRLLLNSCK